MTRNVFVQARANTRPTEWDVGFNANPGPGKVDIDMNGGSEDIVFNLVQTPGLNIQFDRDQPIWTGRGGQCPRQPAVDDDFTVVNAQPMTLTVHDKNLRAGRVNYQLNFRGADPCDPIIINGGGGVGSGGSQ